VEPSMGGPVRQVVAPQPVVDPAGELAIEQLPDP
jgi:hypothetical protein